MKTFRFSVPCNLFIDVPATSSAAARRVLGRIVRNGFEVEYGGADPIGRCIGVQPGYELVPLSLRAIEEHLEVVHVLDAMRLSRPQVAMLRRLAKHEEQTPGGTPDSGRRAAAWHRTLAVLVDRGLADCIRRPHPSAALARITQAGRQWLSEQAGR